MLLRRPPIAFVAVSLLLASVWLGFTPGAAAAPGDLDPSFGVGGLVITDPPSFPDGFFAVVVQPGGGIVGAGLASPDAVLVRYEDDGELDPSFGVGGIVTTNVPSTGSAAALSLARYVDGRLVTAGNPDIAVRRYGDDGTPDPSFGMGGTVDVPVIDGNRPQARAVALQADERIVVAGFVPVPSPTFFPTDAIVVLRFDAFGVPDATFGGGDGIVTTVVQQLASAEVAALLAQPDGALVVAGRSGDRGFLARYLTDGSLDPSFGDAGVVLGERGSVRALARQPDGKLLTVGPRPTSTFASIPVVTRFLTDGALDPTFGEGGRFVFDAAQLDRDVPGLALTGVAVQADDRIVVAGSAFGAATVARLTTKGTLDPGFGDGGITTTTFGTFQSVQALAVQPDGRVLVAGAVDQALAVARYLGSLCGDATLDADEQCDDGNLVDGDGCDANCTPTACGNGVVTAGEQCDDGNVASGDCCTGGCQLEADGSPCDDANLCTATSSCLAGTCTPGAVTSCDDGDPCRIDTCDPPTGLCRHEPDETLVCQQQNRALENLEVAFFMASHRSDGAPDLLRPVLVLGDHVIALSRGGEDAAIEIFDARTGAYQLALDDPTPNDFHFGPIAVLGSDLLVAAEAFRDLYPSEVGRIDRYDGATFAPVRTFFDPTPETSGFATTLLGHAGKVLARDAGSHVVEVFDAATGAHVHTLAAPGGDPQGAFGALLVPFGDHVLVGDAGAVHLFDLGSGNLVRTFVDPTPGGGAFGSVIAVHDTEVLIGGRREGRVYAFDPTTGAVRGTFEDPLPVDKFFGDPVVVAGDDVAIGRGGGRVHVFDGATRGVRLTILDPLPSTGHCFGRTILPVFGDRLAIADPCFGPGSVTGDTETGQVYLFDHATGALRSIIRNPEHDDHDGFTVVGSYQDTLFTYIKGFSDGTVFAHRPCANGRPAFGGECHDGPCADPDFCPGPCDFMGCGLCTRCDTATVSCIGAPRDACTGSARPDRTTLHLRRKSPRLEWRWRAGTALAPGALGDPVAGDRYGICLYEEDDTGSRLLLNGQPYLYQSWRRTADGSFVFRDRARETGIERLVLQTGRVGRAGITARLASPSTPLPDQPVSTRLRVQLQSATSDACWESVHDPADAGRNGPRDFRGPARSDAP